MYYKVGWKKSKKNLNEDLKSQALEEAQRTYKGFLSVAKKFSIGAIALIVFMFTQNWLVDGTGSKSDPAMYEEYLDNIESWKK